MEGNRRRPVPAQQRRNRRNGTRHSRKIENRIRQIGRHYILAQDLIETVSGRGFRAMRDCDLVPVLITQHTLVAVIDYVPAHRFCMTVNAIRARAILCAVDGEQISDGPRVEGCCDSLKHPQLLANDGYSWCRRT